MLLKPDDLPPMVKGEARNVMFKLGGAVGANTITSASFTSVPDRLTFGTPSTTGTNVTVLVNAVQSGEYQIWCTATLSSSETIKGRTRVKIEDPEACGENRY